ncbi:NTP/H+ exchange transporter Npt2 [Chlamydia trachomatis]|uniref:ADP,ATP carrier protein n=3 Tax=Chlamydia trachomatis TaxID=813 RepID=A0A6H2W4X0_CHLTB|nr:NTP/H+ exchange transporter Npt2 [Chlamydia trachomatis]AGJ64867.1 ATPase AAA [Chlamydia trachomatis L2/434/Bu(i)]AGJ65809.1 ATPase AAA [Chlamydia trachomatis L2/434/Bu(f)]AGR94849.1 putative nucleotide transport protein [Chlamydia trachomatis RC-L2(s)/46]AGR96728.1 putative nucleotide transport protein [Chlamydia trachomatis RC-J/943]AGR98569.1 putative nucleotide transport protein [Chlamydia trachomatis RC-L2(s)/3]
MSSEVKSFSKFRGYFFPIYRSEFSKFIPLFFLAFFVGVNYALLKTTKDSLVLVGSRAGAEVIPFLKVWGIVPGAVIVTMIYGWMSRRYSRGTVFISLVGGFLGFFALFATVIYPIGDALHLNKLAAKLQSILPPGGRGFVVMVQYWSYSLYYVMSELWSSVVLSTLFWGVANHITSVREAGRFYALINTGLNLSSVFAGEVSLWLGRSPVIAFPMAVDPWHEMLLNITLLIVLAGGVILYLYQKLDRLMDETSMLEEGLAAEMSVAQLKKEKKRSKAKAKSLFALLLRSRYLLGIAVVVLSYNLVIHLFEVVWKDQVCRIYASRVEFNSYMSRITTLTGIVSALAGIFAAGQTIRRWGWTVGALVPPLTILITGALFFGAIYAVKGDAMIFGGILGISPLVLTAWLGGVQNVFSRAIKFTYFDQTKEMAFIPLEDDEKNYGKAAIDGVISRVGKSGGSLVYQGLLIIFSSVAASLNAITIVLLLALGSWIFVIAWLGREYTAKTETLVRVNASEEDVLQEEREASSLVDAESREEPATTL